MRPTIKDIAAYCNVSEGTVDRALNNRYGISERTKKRVLDAMEALNYRPNYMGRALAIGSSMTIGIVCFDLYNNFFPELIDTIEARAKEKGFFINLILTHMDRTLEREGLHYLSSRGVDGIILFPIGVGKEYVEYINGLNVPIVTLFNRVNDCFPHVAVDERGAFKDSVQFLAERGYRRIVFFSPLIDSQERIGNNVNSLRMRWSGYCDGIKSLNMSPIIVEGREQCKQMALQYANESSAIRTAILCSSDSYALSIMEAMTTAGIQVPDQLGIMGFDNVDMLKLIHPRLTTVQYSVADMGTQLFDLLYEQIQGNKCAHEVLLPYSIVEGETV